MRKPSGETGIVIFSSVDANAKLVTPQFSGGYISLESAWKQILVNVSNSVGMSRDKSAVLQGYKLPLTTFQLLCTPETEATPEQVKALRILFLEVRNRLKQSERFNYGK